MPDFGNASEAESLLIRAKLKMSTRLEKNKELSFAQRKIFLKEDFEEEEGCSDPFKNIEQAYALFEGTLF